MARRHPWNIRCTAHRKGGEPCSAWSVRGGFVCIKHGGAAPQVRRAAADRLAADVAGRKLDLALARGFAEVNRRMATEPDAVLAGLRRDLYAANRRLARFKAANGRGPRGDEWRLVAGG